MAGKGRPNLQEVKGVMMKKRMSLALAGTMLAAAPAGAATQVVDSEGILTGAKGVTIGKKTYDVTFTNGTCAGVYGKCEASSFDFSTNEDAMAAVGALKEQVFINTAAGKFATDTKSIKGCTSGTICLSIVAFATVPKDKEYTVAFWANTSGVTSVGNDSVYMAYDTTGYRSLNIARFALTAADNGVTGAVPEPATWAMMLVGFAAVGAAVRRRRQGVAVRVA